MTNVISNLNGVYLKASYYDIVFNRDISRQIGFCLNAYEHFTGKSAQSALDLACGPGYYAQGFARAGLKAVGLDLSAEMLHFGRNLSQKENLPVDFVEADMSHFQLDYPVDIAICMFDAIDLLTSDESIIRHFQAVADNLSEGGLYLLEQTHPAHVYHEGMESLHWYGEQDGVEVEFIWGANRPPNDIISACAEVKMEMHVNDHGNKFVIHDSSVERTRSLQELRLVAEQINKRFKAVGYYGDFSLDQPLDRSSDSVRMITIFQKQ